MTSYYVSGTVTAVKSRQGTSKAGKPFTIHIATINGTDIEVGFKQPFKIGDTATLDVEYAYKSYRMTSLPANSSNPPIPNSASGTTFVGSPVPTSSDFPIRSTDGRQTAIIRQNALTNAVALINGGVSVNLVEQAEDGKIPAYVAKLSKEDQDAIRDQAALAIEIAYKFASFSSGNLDQEFLTPKDSE